MKKSKKKIGRSFPQVKGGNFGRIFAQYQGPGVKINRAILEREVGGTAGITQACMSIARNKNFEIPFSGKAGFVYVEDVIDIIFHLIIKK